MRTNPTQERGTIKTSYNARNYQKSTNEKAAWHVFLHLLNLPKLQMYTNWNTDIILLHYSFLCLNWEKSSVGRGKVIKKEKEKPSIAVMLHLP